jgi:hypothetical protein
MPRNMYQEVYNLEPTMIGTQVKTVVSLDLYPITGLNDVFPDYRDALTAVAIGNLFDVKITLEHNDLVTMCYISGTYENVFKCIADEWGSNEIPPEVYEHTNEITEAGTQQNFVHMLLGDPMAKMRWNKGEQDPCETTSDDAPQCHTCGGMFYVIFPGPMDGNVCGTCKHILMPGDQTGLSDIEVTDYNNWQLRNA